tara:strand:+ start:33 stop:203 length:171 start_codon:yes stop_codon:yes gene_type:complete
MGQSKSFWFEAISFEPKTGLWSVLSFAQVSCEAERRGFAANECVVFEFQGHDQPNI